MNLCSSFLNELTIWFLRDMYGLDLRAVYLYPQMTFMKQMMQTILKNPLKLLELYFPTWREPFDIDEISARLAAEATVR